MALDFSQLKAIPITDVVLRYGVQLKFRGEWGSGKCPLPSHKKDDKERSFSVSTAKNYWKCFSASCNESSGCKGGDTINFVALMENCSQIQAAKKLAEIFHVGEKETPQRMAEASKKPEMQSSTKELSTSRDSVKYTEKVRDWFDAIWPRLPDEDDEGYKKRLLKSITTELIENFRAGRAGRIL